MENRFGEITDIDKILWDKGGEMKIKDINHENWEIRNEMAFPELLREIEIWTKKAGTTEAEEFLDDVRIALGLPEELPEDTAF